MFGKLISINSLFGRTGTIGSVGRCSTFGKKNGYQFTNMESGICGNREGHRKVRCVKIAAGGGDEVQHMDFGETIRNRDWIRHHF